MKCNCEGFRDAWDQRSESHYTVTVHDEECAFMREEEAFMAAEAARDAAKDEAGWES